MDDRRPPDPSWHHDAVIYQLHVKAFRDSNRDGFGDFRGLIRELDYIAKLGVTAVWLLPFYPSPLRDDGYDIADYTSVHPNYGTIEDFKEFLDAAHARGLKVITELVINHTSDRHPWFQRARAAPRGSPERDFYVWTDDVTKYAGARIIFTDTETSNWAWDPVAQQFYWHRFFSHQPDLNFDNPAVLEAVLDVMRFWLRLGVDGLRLDAIPYLIERDGTSCENLPETHVVLKKLRATLDAEFEHRVFLAEANQWPDDVRPYFGDGDECHMAFHFPVMPRMYMAVAREDRTPVVDIMARTPHIPPQCQWAIFLRNHDELTLEMVTDDERAFMYGHYAKDVRMRINVGIRRRLAPLMENGRKEIELMHALLMSLPGSPVMYYGDELGMGDNIYLGDRNGVRTPMQWSADRNAGFSEAAGAALYAPVISDPPYDYHTVNVAAQEELQTSLLRWVRAIVTLRQRYQAFGRGRFEPLAPQNRRVLAFLRRYDDEVILCVNNLARHAQYVELDLREFSGWSPIELWSGYAFPAIRDCTYLLTLNGRDFLWFKLQPPGGPERLGAVAQVGA
jgi:maltose alpha-D-glucosyltransferase/alpha-amylase